MENLTFNFRAVRLASGAHNEAGSELCVMEAVAYIAGEKHSDKPACVCSVIGAAARRINDWMTQNERDEFLAPMLFDFAGTVGTREDKINRGYIAADYAVRVFAPMRMRSRGHIKFAEMMEAIGPVTDKVSAIVARDESRRVQNAAYAAAAYAAYAAADAYAAAAYAANADADAAAADAYAAAAYAANADADAAANANANAAYAYAAAAYAANANADDAYARRKVCEQAVQMLKDMIAVKNDAPCEWARAPESLPCLVNT